MAVVDKVLTEVESMMEKFEGLELSLFAKELEECKGDKEKMKSAFACRGVTA